MPFRATASACPPLCPSRRQLLSGSGADPHVVERSPCLPASRPRGNNPEATNVRYVDRVGILEMVVSISFPAPRMRASDWKSDLPVGDITGRMGFQRVATSTSTAQSMHGSLREDSPKDATDKRRGAAEELERRDLAGSVIPCFPS
ncbi:predicted protein [Chaetomium globosum CBS 148.51]|uniref:Uncharacterized protein n=1 Tax=Chaetomium globosum (strain ATCC 6205 / CBS 148.51 / DSM 1962 / NBRC 6347 / NRRL 1970) TaxID=306901 RepID=Q2GP15_CHAGB|nr:uncharacterized protein CHGG_10289 [Chaetomium globosum CBS 148.51]EAQ83885.1 predicted protein [Chaetomium globosum CBS 148.51]